MFPVSVRASWHKCYFLKFLKFKYGYYIITRLIYCCYSYYFYFSFVVIIIIIVIRIITRKTAGTAENPTANKFGFVTPRYKVVISHRQIYVYHTDLLPFKISVTLSLTFQGHSRYNLIVPLDSPHMVSY